MTSLQACLHAVEEIQDATLRAWMRTFVRNLQQKPKEAFEAAEAIEESVRFEATNGWLLMLQGAGVLPRLSRFTPGAKAPTAESANMARKALLLARGNQELLAAQQQHPDHVMDTISDPLKRCLVYLVCGYLRTGKTCYLQDARNEANQCTGWYGTALGLLAVHLCQQHHQELES